MTIALENRAAEVWATDISSAALAIACGNARKLGARVQFVNADLLASFKDRVFDVIVSNPPYVGLHESAGLQTEVREYEPHLALFAGETGNEIYRQLIDQALDILRPGGWLLFELGWRSLEPVRAMLDPRWSRTEIFDDLAGIPRVLAARYKE